MKKTRALLLIALILFSLSCSRSKPEISYGFLQLVIQQSDSGLQEYFSFFILPNDEDGVENLDKLYLYHDKEQLRWQINNDEWVTFQDEGRTWIGTRSITVLEGTLPRGVYRAVLVNKGGESSERNFAFDGNIKFPFPDLTITSGSYVINSEWPANRLICYDSTGGYVSEIPVETFTGTINQLRLPSNVTTVALWAEDEANQCSAYTSVVPVK